MGTIIHVVETPPLARCYHTFGLSELDKNNIQWQILDITPLLHPELTKNYQPADPFVSPNLYRFCSWPELLAKIEALSEKDLLILNLGVTRLAVPFFDAIKKTPALIGSFEINRRLMSPSPSKTNRYLNAVLLICREPRRAKEYYFNWIERRFWHPRVLDFFLFAGELSESLKGGINVAQHTRILESYSTDYEMAKPFLDSKKEKIAVFLDQYIPDHPDFNQMGVRIPIEAASYHAKLVAFFDKFEQQTGLSVVIAAHPRAPYRPEQHPFGKRLLVCGQTARIAATAQMVLAHYSTSISLAVIFKTPLMFLTMQEFSKIYVGKAIETFAEYFGLQAVNLDQRDNTAALKVTPINLERYDTYLKTYVSAGLQETNLASQWAPIIELYKERQR